MPIVIIGPLAVIGGLGLLFGLALGVADKFLAVEVDPKIDALKDAVPGANCGGCGFAGCGAFAEAVFSGDAKTSGCPVGGQSVADKLAEIMGVEAGALAKKVAHVKCGGSCDKAKIRYDYAGLKDCVAATMLAGGSNRDCNFGCLGLGTCQDVCPFDAINVVNGLAFVDPDKCTACGMCIDACPKALIDLANYESLVTVNCNSTEKGKEVKEKCEVGCIACRLCVKACQYDAIVFENNLAKVDYDKCTNCGDCVLKCPTNTISFSGRRKG